MAHVIVEDVNQVITTMLGNIKYSAVVDLLSRKAKERDIRRSTRSRTDAATEDPGEFPSSRSVIVTRRVRGSEVRVAA